MSGSCMKKLLLIAIITFLTSSNILCIFGQNKDKMITVKAQVDLQEVDFSKIRKELYPHFKEEFHNFIASFINFENAIQFGAPIALFGFISLTGFYGTRLFWRVLEKRLLSTKPVIRKRKKVNATAGCTIKNGTLRPIFIL